MITTYLDNQASAINKLKKVKCGALFMEAGTGKTRTAIDLIRSTDTDYVLWLTPFQTKDNLKEELLKWGGIDCDIVGIETIQSSDSEYLKYHSKLEDSKKAFIVCDESLKIKNIEAKRTRLLIKMSELSEYRLILNGTPLSRNLLDLWSQMQFLSPKILKMSLPQFKNTFCEYISITKRNGKSSFTKEFIKAYHNIDYLYSLIEPFIFESKLSLSVGQVHIDLKYKLSDGEKKEHNRLKDKYLNDDYMILKNNNIFLEITQKMQHNYSLSEEKFNIVDSIIKEKEQDKILIFAKYINTQKKLKEYYKGIEIKSIAKHSYGLNLQNYNTIIFWDKTWDYAQREQMERRIYRQGQKDECTYYDLTGDVGLEKMINENIERKRNLLDVFNETSIDKLKEKL